MQHLHGTAPVYLHEILYGLQTAVGSRPRPVKDKSEEMQPIPVRVMIATRGGRVIEDGMVIGLTLPCFEWALHPYQSQERDKDTGAIVRDEQKSEFVLCAVLPVGFRIVDDNKPAVEDKPSGEPVEAAPVVPGEIPELANLDPVIFAPNPDAVNRAMREIFAKGKTNEGAEG